MPAEPPGLGGPREAGQAVSPDAAVGNPAWAAGSRSGHGTVPVGPDASARRGSRPSSWAGWPAALPQPPGLRSPTRAWGGRSRPPGGGLGAAPVPASPPPSIPSAPGPARRPLASPPLPAASPQPPGQPPPSIPSAPAASLPLPAASPPPPRPARRSPGLARRPPRPACRSPQQPAAFHPVGPCGQPVGPRASPPLPGASPPPPPGPARRLLPPRPPRRLPPPTCRPAAAATWPLPLAAATGRPPAGSWRRDATRRPQRGGRNAAAAGVGQAPRAGSVRLSRPVSTCPASCRVTPGALTVTSYQPSVVRTRWVTAVPGRRR